MVRPDGYTESARAETEVPAVLPTWRIVSQDGPRSAHFEHTVAITGAGPRLLTLAAAVLSR